jgi:superfamily I DNA/RNA helicase
MGKVDSWVIVGTKLDTKQLEKDLKNSEKMLKSYEKEAEKLTKAEAKAKTDLEPYREEIRLLEESVNESLAAAKNEDQRNFALKGVQQNLDDINEKYAKQISAYNEINQKLEENAKKFHVCFDDDRFVEYNFDEANQLNLAYAVTIHKSQGSEFPVVIIPILTQHFVMLQRNLLYTGMTRAKKLLILIGSAKAIDIAVRNTRKRPRYSNLLKRLTESAQNNIF